MLYTKMIPSNSSMTFLVPNILSPKYLAPNGALANEKRIILVKMTIFYFKSICNHKKYTEGLSLKVFSKGQNTSCIVCWGRNLTSEACPISMYKFPWFIQQFVSMGSKIISLSLKKKSKICWLCSENKYSIGTFITYTYIPCKRFFRRKNMLFTISTISF